MKKIYKYSLKYDQVFGNALQGALTLPRSPEFLSAGAQGSNLVLWAEVSDGPLEEEVYMTVGTGRDLPDGDWDYFDTVQMADGLVWHIYIWV